MSKFIGHIPCPKCGSKDNLAEYDDHFWCFGCRYHKVKDDIHTLRKRAFKHSEDPPSLVGLMNCSRDLPQTAMKWLLSYGISKDEIEQYDFQWCEDNELLVLYNKDGYWQGRSFADNRPKYLSGGNKPLTIYGSGNKIVCVEDILSAIKIARLSPDYCSTPLLGSSMPLETTQSLIERFNDVIVWLDRDKAKNAIKIARNLKQRGINSEVVISPLDPKEYNKEEIKQWLRSR